MAKMHEILRNFASTAGERAEHETLILATTEREVDRLGDMLPETGKYSVTRGKNKTILAPIAAGETVQQAIVALEGLVADLKLQEKAAWVEHEAALGATEAAQLSLGGAIGALHRTEHAADLATSSYGWVGDTIHARKSVTTVTWGRRRRSSVTLHAASSTCRGASHAPDDYRETVEPPPDARRPQTRHLGARGRRRARRRGPPCPADDRQRGRAPGGRGVRLRLEFLRTGGAELEAMLRFEIEAEAGLQIDISLDAGSVDNNLGDDLTLDTAVDAKTCP